MTGFITKSLGELTSIMTKGIAPKYVEEESNSTIVVLNQKCNRDFSISLEQSRLNDCNKKAVSPERMLHKYDVLINSTGTGTAGRVAQLFNVPEPMTIDGHMILIRPTDEIDPIYYGYAVKAHQAEIEMLAEGSTGQTEINRKRLSSEIMISFPVDIESQKQIGELLYQIDQKIWNNTAINDNLYQQLDTIYRATYPYLPSDELPAGWNCVPLGTLCDSISIKHSFDKEKLVFLNTGDVENGHFLHSTYSLVQEMPGQAKKSIKTNDILYSEIRPINRHFAFVNFQADDYVVSTKLMVIRSREMDSRRLYHFLTTQDVINELQIEAESRSGTFPQIRFENIQRLPIIIASPDIELQFTQILKDYYNMIDSNICENQHLATLHDSILPKLMSGEIDVSELDI